MRHRIIDTFTGPFALIQHDDGRLTTSWLNAEVQIMLSESKLDRNLLPALTRQLREYFEGADVDFSNVSTPTGSEFFVKCWNVCRTIPRGETWTYGELAERAGSTSMAARAAGQAMRHNPLPIIVPCHRVIGSGGRLHGFGGSCDIKGQELAIKSALLKLEHASADPAVTTRPTRASQRRSLAMAV